MITIKQLNKVNSNQIFDESECEDFQIEDP